MAELIYLFCFVCLTVDLLTINAQRIQFSNFIPQGSPFGHNPNVWDPRVLRFQNQFPILTFRQPPRPLTPLPVGDSNGMSGSQSGSGMRTQNTQWNPSIGSNPMGNFRVLPSNMATSLQNRARTFTNQFPQTNLPFVGPPTAGNAPGQSLTGGGALDLSTMPNFADRFGLAWGHELLRQLSPQPDTGTTSFGESSSDSNNNQNQNSLQRGQGNNVLPQNIGRPSNPFMPANGIIPFGLQNTIGAQQSNAQIPGQGPGANTLFGTPRPGQFPQGLGQFQGVLPQMPGMHTQFGRSINTGFPQLGPGNTQFGRSINTGFPQLGPGNTNIRAQSSMIPAPWALPAAMRQTGMPTAQTNMPMPVNPGNVQGNQMQGMPGMAGITSPMSGTPGMSGMQGIPSIQGIPGIQSIPGMNQGGNNQMSPIPSFLNNLPGNNQPGAFPPVQGIRQPVGIPAFPGIPGMPGIGQQGSGLQTPGNIPGNGGVPTFNGMNSLSNNGLNVNGPNQPSINPQPPFQTLLPGNAPPVSSAGLNQPNLMMGSMGQLTPNLPQGGTSTPVSTSGMGIQSMSGLSGTTGQSVPSPFSQNPLFSPLGGLNQQGQLPNANVVGLGGTTVGSGQPSGSSQSGTPSQNPVGVGRISTRTTPSTDNTASKGESDMITTITDNNGRVLWQSDRQVTRAEIMQAIRRLANDSPAAASAPASDGQSLSGSSDTSSTGNSNPSANSGTATQNGISFGTIGSNSVPSVPFQPPSNPVNPMSNPIFNFMGSPNRQNPSPGSQGGMFGQFLAGGQGLQNNNLRAMPGNRGPFTL